MSQRLPLLLAAAGTGGGLGGLGVQVLSELLRFGRVDPGPPVPMESSSPALDLPYSLDFPSLCVGVCLELCIGPLLDLLFLPSRLG